MEKQGYSGNALGNYASLLNCDSKYNSNYLGAGTSSNNFHHFGSTAYSDIDKMVLPKYEARQVANLKKEIQESIAEYNIKNGIEKQKSRTERLLKEIRTEVENQNKHAKLGD